MVTQSKWLSGKGWVSALTWQKRRLPARPWSRRRSRPVVSMAALISISTTWPSGPVIRAKRLTRSPLPAGRRQFLTLAHQGQDAGRGGEGLAPGEQFVDARQGSRARGAPGLPHGLEVLFNSTGGQLRLLALDPNDGQVHRALKGVEVEGIDGTLVAATRKGQQQEEGGDPDHHPDSQSLGGVASKPGHRRRSGFRSGLRGKGAAPPAGPAYRRRYRDRTGHPVHGYRWGW